MRRLSTLWLVMTWLVAGMPHALARAPSAIATRATLKSITVTDPSLGKEVLVQIDGEYSFKTIHTPEGAVYVDLLGVRLGHVPPSAHWANGLFAGYQLLAFTDASGEPVLRVKVQTRGSEPLTAERGSSGLRLLLGQSAPASGTPTPPAKGALSSPGKTAEGPALVSDILIRPGSAGEVTIDVATRESATFHVYRFDHPERLVLDVEGVRNAVRRKLIPVSSPTVKDVRVGQFREKDPEVVRVVADLSGNPLFDAHAYAGGVRVEVKPRSMAVPRTVAPAPAPTLETAAKRDDLRLDYSRTLPASEGSTDVAAAPRQTPQAATPEALRAERAAQVLNVETASNLPAAQGAVPAGSAPASVAAPPQQTPQAATPEAVPAGSASASVAAAPQQTPQAATPEAVPAGSASASVAAAPQQTPQAATPEAAPAGSASPSVPAAPQQTPQAATPEALRAERAAQVLNVETASNPPAAQGAVPAGSAPPGEQKPVYTGELISLNLKDVDLKDFFRLIHELSGLNILVDPNVTGSVTTVLDNVPWDQALDIVLKNNGLGKVLEGNVLRIAKLDTLTAEQETANKMAAARLEAAPLVTVFRPVNYAKASAIATLLKTWAAGKESSGGLSKRGTVLVDERTNTLVISDVASQIPVVQGVIARLDTKTKQVAIETRIVLANSTFQRTLSAALVGTVSNPSGSTTGAGQTGSQASVTPSTTTTPPSFTIPQNATAGFGVVAITNFSQRYMIDAAISAAEIRSLAKTISRPSIITQTNTEGMVQQGTQIPVQTSINNTISVQYVNATLQLTVTPQVTDDGHIFLKINVQNASPGSIVTQAAVSINIQQATTYVLVPDGGTVVFGGVTVTQRQNSVTQIPVLGNIPLLGNLFKTTTVQDSDQELLFFVSPRLLTT
jgi:type IV pilus assembly protein PilQ